MSHNQSTHAPRSLPRVSPCAGQRSNVVSLDAWRKAHASRPNVPGQRGAAVGPRPDRLGRALAWCQAFSTTGRNPFDPARLQQGLD